MKKLLVTDLDDTLYNWMGFFVPSFFAMVDEIVSITGLPKEQLLREYKEKHQYYKSVEFPYVSIKLPSVLAKYPGLQEDELKALFRPAFNKFNAIRDENLKLFPGVAETLAAIRQSGVTIVGFTESSQENGFFRMLKLGIAEDFTHVYAFESQFEGDFTLNPKIRIVTSKKPNPALLLTICAEEGFSPAETLYMGDSLSKDVYMALNAGIDCVWADYPEKYPEYAEMLLAVTSWLPEEYEAETQRKAEMLEKGLVPNHVVHHYPELIDILRQYE